MRKSLKNVTLRVHFDIIEFIRLRVNAVLIFKSHRMVKGTKNTELEHGVVQVQNVLLLPELHPNA